MAKIKFPVHRPKTSFPMKANLVQNEPASHKRWDTLDVYDALRQRESPKGAFVFHDGPPYANGDIHLGHMLNKVLKDLVVRSKSMAGYDCPYTPGWDCHGLPIEHKVMQDLGEAGRAMEPLKIRQKCQKYASKFVKLQGAQMQRLLTMADYADPYLTMLPRYEAGVVNVFAGMIEKGLVYRDLKPVHWSIDNQTALAEAELEYQDREDTSVFVQFDLTSRDREGAVASVPEKTSLMIWTTTPWTLPANLAVAVHPRYEYGLYQAGDHQVILAVELAAKVLVHAGLEAGEPLQTWKGQELVGTTYKHPFIDRVSKVVAAEYVTLEDGTGLVHTAPGHGTEDYQTGLREGLDVYCPVQADGTYDETVPEWLIGKSIWVANDEVVECLRTSGHLFHDQKFMHSYPHDWRSKKPVIFRATEQWFIGVDIDLADGVTLRNKALNVTANDVNFIPDWGRNRMRGMLESRPDWCISRQRSWGLPIPAFFNENNEPLLTVASVRAVAQVFSEKGSDAWFFMTPEDLLQHYKIDEDPDAPAWLKARGWPSPGASQLIKGKDTFDVWFESGSSWNAVMREGWNDKQSGNGYPIDLYLEGSDQHRGWFQHSLLPGLAVTGESPFKTVLTHGFMVDKDGRKMSKSGGNALAIETLMKDYGADVCRWWVASLNPDNDIKVDMEFFKLAGEAYRKVRNTLRVVLGNLDGFDPAKHSVDIEPASIDAWVLGELDTLIQDVKVGYESLRFRGVSEKIFTFCNETLSALYVNATKDRLYCDAENSPRRRSTQTALHRIVTSLCPLLAPIMPHTADEAWRLLHAGDENACVHLTLFPTVSNVEVGSAWANVLRERDGWLKTIEDARQQQGIDNPLDVGLTVPVFAGSDKLDVTDLADLCGVSRFEFGESLNVTDLRDEPKCDRSWKRDGSVKGYTFDDQAVQLSARDAAVLGLS